MLTPHTPKPLFAFQPTLPLRGATAEEVHDEGMWEFQPTLPLRGATAEISKKQPISESFNPRSPCGERHKFLEDMRYFKVFQPTLPLRGATG